jgi:hypothetical protein
LGNQGLQSEGNATNQQKNCNSRNPEIHCRNLH